VAVLFEEVTRMRSDIPGAAGDQYVCQAPSSLAGDPRKNTVWSAGVGF
jgi:hypothetical protein